MQAFCFQVDLFPTFVGTNPSVYSERVVCAAWEHSSIQLCILLLLDHMCRSALSMFGTRSALGFFALKAWLTICGEFFLSRRTSLLWKSRKSLISCIPRGYLPVSPHIRIFEVLLLTLVVHFSSERCRRSMLSFANCVSVSLSDCVFLRQMLLRMLVYRIRQPHLTTV